MYLKGPMRRNQDRKNRVRKWRVVGIISGRKYSGKGHKDRNRHKNRIKRSGQARLVYVRHKPQEREREREREGGERERGSDSTGAQGQ